MIDSQPDIEAKLTFTKSRVIRPSSLIGSSAVFDRTGKYRYSLHRHWSIGAGSVTFIMLNPSTADHEHNDPTIRRCIGLAHAWGFNTLNVVNLFALRATEPAELKKARSPVGGQNNLHIASNVEHADQIVIAWGNHGQFRGRDKAVLELLSGYNLLCLGRNLCGQPKHPLYVSRNSRLIRFDDIYSDKNNRAGRR